SAKAARPRRRSRTRDPRRGERLFPAPSPDQLAPVPEYAREPAPCAGDALLRRLLADVEPAPRLLHGKLLEVDEVEDRPLRLIEKIDREVERDRAVLLLHGAHPARRAERGADRRRRRAVEPHDAAARPADAPHEEPPRRAPEVRAQRRRLVEPRRAPDGEE